jgi:hypothetical protein
MHSIHEIFLSSPVRMIGVGVGLAMSTKSNVRTVLESTSTRTVQPHWLSVRKLYSFHASNIGLMLGSDWLPSLFWCGSWVRLRYMAVTMVTTTRLALVGALCVLTYTICETLSLVHRRQQSERTVEQNLKADLIWYLQAGVQAAQQ